MPTTTPADPATRLPHHLITGGAGFIGSHLAETLLTRSDAVTVLDDESTGARANLARCEANQRFRYVSGSAMDASTLNALLNEATDVYHLAAAVGVGLIERNVISTIERNIQPTLLLLESLRSRLARGQRIKLFLASSSEVYGKNPKETWSEDDDLVFGPTTTPRWSYGASKAIDEFLALAAFQQDGLPIVIGRMFNVVGPRQTGRHGMVLPRLVAAALAGRSPVVHDDGAQIRCFAHVRDVVRCIIALMDSPAAVGTVFNVGGDQPITIGHLAQRVIDLVNPGLTIAYQSYAEAYSPTFEDVRRRVPNLARLRTTIEVHEQYDLDRIILDVAEALRGG